jgi:hypothetical protein
MVSAQKQHIVRGLFILTKLDQRYHLTFRKIFMETFGAMGRPKPGAITQPEWEKLTAGMGATPNELRDVPERMGKV